MRRADGDDKLKVLTAAADLYSSVSVAFDMEPDLPRSPVNERERYVSALAFVAQFFCALENRRLGDRFFELSFAIADLNSGTKPPLLKAIDPVNRPPDCSQLWGDRARVAVILEALMKSGLSRESAARKLALKHPRLAKLAGAGAKNTTLQTTILGWRKAFSASRVKNFLGQVLFSEGQKIIEGLSGAELITFAEQRLAELKRRPWELSPGA
jgi:hypothetical protein